MIIDLGSFAFGSTIKNSSGTPSWGTALGQSSPDYKMTYSGVEDIIMGLVYNMIPKKYVSMPIGKGGHVYTGEESDEIQIAGLFKKVYVNGIRIPYPFIMILQKEDSNSHNGRRSIKYSNKIEFIDQNKTFKNSLFIEKVRETFQIANEGCWFAYSIDIKNQDTLHIKIKIVDKDKNVEYDSADARKKEWNKLISNENNDVLHLLHPTPIQKIYFGSPGTGKSFAVKTKVLNGISDEFIFRTTFHPDSDYASFVGCYKPRMSGGKIEYAFTPQVFTKAYCKAWKNPDRQVFLVIEEINRGNCAQIFGDLFQLLDRKGGVSEYPIDADEDMKAYLETALKECEHNEPDGSEGIEGGKLRLPANLNIVATMNTSDQSLFPMDSAFKRRWDWTYVPTKTSFDKSWKMVLDSGEKSAGEDNSKISAGEHSYRWSDFLDAINRRILSTTRSEDKQIGFWFITPGHDGNISISEFVSKVVFYLWNDVFKDLGPKDTNPFTVTDRSGVKTVMNFNSFFEDNSDGETVESISALHTFFSNLGLTPEPSERTDVEIEAAEQEPSEETAE